MAAPKRWFFSNETSAAKKVAKSFQWNVWKWITSGAGRYGNKKGLYVGPALPVSLKRTCITTTRVV